VFSFGGIVLRLTITPPVRRGGAHAALRLHPDAEREIRARFGGEATPQRLKMGEFPEGSRIIPIR